MAKRMVLVDEKMLEYQPMLRHFQTKQDMSWKRPMEQTIKSSINQQMKSTLDDPTIPEDVKVKQYGQNLNRFLHTKRQLTEPEEDIKPPEPELPQVTKKKTPRVSARRKRKPKKPAIEPEEKPRISARISLRRARQPKPFVWDEWK